MDYQTASNRFNLDNAINKLNGLDFIDIIKAAAKREVFFIKTQIEVDFPDTKDQNLLELRFNGNLRNVQSNDQEALIQLLYALKKE